MELGNFAVEAVSVRFGPVFDGVAGSVTVCAIPSRLKTMWGSWLGIASSLTHTVVGPVNESWVGPWKRVHASPAVAAPRSALVIPLGVTCGGALAEPSGWGAVALMRAGEGDAGRTKTSPGELRARFPA